jgi:ubiquinone biosynthesis accessory factor UbiJ
MAALVDLLVPVLNHLLAHEDWARQRLGPYAGQTFRIEGGPAPLPMTVTESGSLRPASTEESPSVTVAFPVDAPVRLLFDAAGVLASAKLTGAANFAETLAFVFRNLRWDYEADLAGVVGDIPAHRIARLLGEGLAWQRSMLQRLGSNLTEFATEESALVTRASEMDLFCGDVDRLRDDLARLEKRISRLSS